MTESENRLREALGYVATATHAGNRLDRFAGSPGGRLSSPLKAAAAFLLVLGVTIPLILNSVDSSDGVGAQPTTQPTIPGSDAGTDSSLSTSTVPPTAVFGVEVDVSAAVAPYDHESFVDNLLFEMSLAGVRNQQVFDCITAAGFTPPTASALPERDDPGLYSAAFPDVEALARDGFPDPTAAESPPGATSTTAPPGEGSIPSGEASAAYASVSRECADQVDDSEGDAVVAYQLYATMRGAWEMVLAEIDATDEIRSLVDGLGVCLREQGVPAEATGWNSGSMPEYTDSEHAYLGYVDSLLAAAADETASAEIRQHTGKIYADCGRELFATRDAVRGGERREAFLGEHQESIDQLRALILGLRWSPTTSTVPESGTTTTVLGDEALLACMVGTWTLDNAGYEAEVQANVDPHVDSLLVTVESGNGTLTIGADQTFTVAYDQLTIRIQELRSTGIYPIPDRLVVVSGEVTAGFALDGNVFLAGDIDGDPLVVLNLLPDGTWAEVPPQIREASLRLGTRLNRPYYMEKITIECRGDSLVVNDELPLDLLTEDGPSTVWVRDGG